MRPAGPNYALSAPELRPITTQVFNENFGRKALRIITGDAHVKTFSEVHLSCIRQHFGRNQFRHGSGDWRKDRRQLPVRSEGHGTRRPPLVLPHRATPPSASAGIAAQRPTRRRPARPRAPQHKSRRPRRRRLASRFGRRQFRIRAQNLLARKSIADARAELTAPQIRVEDTAADQRRSPQPASRIARARSRRMQRRHQSHVASRWPESSDATSAASNPRLAAAEPAASPQTQLRRHNPPRPRSRSRRRIRRWKSNRPRCRCCC